MTQSVSLHPSMTLTQCAVWCASHDMVLHITWEFSGLAGDALVPACSATPRLEYELEAVHAQ